MVVTGDGLDFRVAKALAEHREALAERETPGHEEAGEAMHMYTLEPGLVPNRPPRRVQTEQAGARGCDLKSPTDCSASGVVWLEFLSPSATGEPRA